MDAADIVATDPPSSLFREYVTTLVERGKKFVIIGPSTGIKYKEVFGSAPSPSQPAPEPQEPPYRPLQPRKPLG